MFFNSILNSSKDVSIGDKMNVTMILAVAECTGVSPEELAEKIVTMATSDSNYMERFVKSFGEKVEKKMQEKKSELTK